MVKPLYVLASKSYDLFNKKPVLEKTLFILLLLVIAGIGIYLRIIPALNHGLELHANDPWIEYWQANYTYHHGVLSWYTLTQDNPATHKFWYPWGRNFVTTSYPGLPIWSALTYNLARFTGLSLKEWVALQPVIFAGLSYITLYLASKEISRGNKLAILASFTLYSIVPAASDRSVVGFVEKEGIALVFIFLVLYFYSKLARIVNETSVAWSRKLCYSMLTGLSIAAVGWFWGGFIYVLGTFIAFVVLYPLFNPRAITADFLKYHFLAVVAAIVFVAPSPSILVSLRFLPYSPKGIGTIMLIALILPSIFWLLHTGYKKIGLKKRLLNQTRYLGLIILILIVGLALYTQGFISISARYAWALGLRALTPAPPLVQSIEEHQSPLARSETVYEMLVSWGTGFMPLLLLSPLFLAIFGAFYLIYRGGMDQVYLAIAFLIALYSYLNATYMEATASSTGLLVAGIFTGFLLSKAIPSRREIESWKRGRVRAGTGSTGRIVALLLILLISINIVLSGINVYESQNALVYSIMSSGVPLAARCDAWYKAINVLKNNMSDDAVVVAWWDYGYWISVAGGKNSIADGATLNGTQIKILARLLTEKNETKLKEYAKLLKLPPNNTYILVFDVFWLIPDTRDPNSYTVIPYLYPYQLVGLVDIRKSIWMIRIGGRDVSEYLYLYNIANGPAYIAPRFDQPESLPLIYKVMVDGVLVLNQDENKTYRFAWYTGVETALSPQYRRLERDLGIKHEISVARDITGQPNMKYMELAERPLANSSYLKPYKVIAEPFEGIGGKRGEILATIISIYKLILPES